MLASPPAWHVRVTAWAAAPSRVVLDRRVRGNAFDLRLRPRRYGLSVSRRGLTCGTAIAPRGRHRIAVVVRIHPGSRCSIEVDNTPGTRRTKLVSPRRTPRWLLRLAWRQAAALEDPRPREIRIGLGRVDTIRLLGTFTCPYCHGPPGSLPIGTVATVTVDPRTRSVDSFGLR